MTASASPSETAGGGILNRLRMAIGQALDLTGQIERGQAAMPLRDYFEALAESIDTEPLNLTLIGLDAASRAAALGWLCGEEYRLVSALVTGAVALVEMQTAERGYVLVKSGRRQEFDRLEPFLEAVRAAGLIRPDDRSAWLEPMHLALAAPPGLQGLKFLLPESIASVAENHALLARLRSESNVLAIAGPVDYQLDASAAAAIRELAADALAAWAITCGPSPPDSTGRGWAGALDGIGLPGIHLEPGGEAPPRPDFLLDRRSGLRQGLFACQRARRFESALDLLEERVQQDIRQHDARRKALLRRSSASNDTGRDRPMQEASSALRLSLAEWRPKIERELAERNRVRLLPTSVPNNKINNLLEDLTTDHIAKEAIGPLVQLSVAPTVRQDVRRLVGDFVLADLRADLERLKLEISEMTAEATAKLEAAGAGTLALQPETLDESTVWKPLEDSLHLESSFSGELAEKGWRERSMEFFSFCRTPLLLMTGIASPFFALSEGLRRPILKLSPLMLIVGLVWARYAQKVEKHKAAERDVTRLRKTLRPEIRRLYEQALGDWCERAGQHLKGVVSRITQQVDEHLKIRASEIDRDAARQSSELQDKRKAADNLANRLRELGTLAQQVGRVRQAASEARRESERATREALREARQPVRST